MYVSCFTCDDGYDSGNDKEDVDSGDCTRALWFRIKGT